MTIDWCPGIREVCAYWPDARMLRQTFEALELALEDDNDTCIDCSKTIVEVVCRLIVENFETNERQLTPRTEQPSLSEWLSAAVKALKLGDSTNNKFKKLVSAHSKLADALNALRNDAGPASHGRGPFLDRLAVHHRRTAVLSADAIVTFMHEAYLDATIDPTSSKEPWERFEEPNALIDSIVGLSVEVDPETDYATLQFALPGETPIGLQVEPSKLLYLLDRAAYVETLNAARNVALDGSARGEISEALESSEA